MNLEKVFKNKKVIVTGHTGFKGSWLSTWLESLGAEVAGFSIAVPTTPSNFALLGLEQRVRHYLGDIRDLERLGQVLDDFRPENFLVRKFSSPAAGPGKEKGIYRGLCPVHSLFPVPPSRPPGLLIHIT